MSEAENTELSKAGRERIGKEWIERIQESERREDDWRKAAEGAEAAYLCDDKSENGKVPDFNILHSNVETIVPAIYNSTPRPEIRPRHTREDKQAKFVADVYERAISTLIDDNRLDAEIEAGAQDAFMAGRDIVRIKFDATVTDMVEVDPFTGEETPVGQQVSDESVLYENVSWRDYREGPAKRWDAVPWVAYCHEVSDEEREKLENPDYREEGDKKDQKKDCKVWEIWCKETRRVYFVVEETSNLLNIHDDPLGLEGFFPQGEPVQPITGTGKRTPVCPYTVYKSLAEELDTASRRIAAIMKGLKVRGAIAGDATVIDLISDAGDNELVAVPNIENLVATGGLDKAVMWWPIDMAISVLKELYIEREQTKQAIYEITGISDIIRGQGAASETATAQQIKTEWGSLRVKKMQRLIERQVRDLFAITAELIAKHFSIERISQLSGMQIPEEIAPLVKEWDKYRIDVESDSTVRADLQKNRSEMSEFLNGTASFFQTMAPIVQQAPQAAGPLAKMYSAFASQFNLGKQAEDALDQFVQMAEDASKQPQPNPEAEAAKAEMQLKQADHDLKKADLLLRAKVAEAEHGIKQDEMALKEAEAEVSAAGMLAEIEIEEDQERPAAVGNN